MIPGDGHPLDTAVLLAPRLPEVSMHCSPGAPSALGFLGRIDVGEGVGIGIEGNGKLQSKVPPPSDRSRGARGGTAIAPSQGAIVIL